MSDHYYPNFPMPLAQTMYEDPTAQARTGTRVTQAGDLFSVEFEFTIDGGRGDVPWLAESEGNPLPYDSARSVHDIIIRLYRIDDFMTATIFMAI